MPRPGEFNDRIDLEEITGLGDGVWTAREAGPSLWADVQWQLGGAEATIRILFGDGTLKSDRDIGRGLRVLFDDHVLTVDHITEVIRAEEVHLTCHDVIVTTDVLATGAHQVTGRLADGTDQ